MGDSAYCEPHKMLIGPRDLKKAMNAVYRRADRVDGWKDEDRALAAYSAEKKEAGLERP